MVDRDARSMSDFNPSIPCEVYDELNEQRFEWKPRKWAASYRRHSSLHDPKRSVIEWDGLLLAGWRPIG
jgi:hypothetical protein